MFILKNCELTDKPEHFEYLVGCRQMWKPYILKPAVAKRFARMFQLEPVNAIQWNQQNTPGV